MDAGPHAGLAAGPVSRRERLVRWEDPRTSLAAAEERGLSGLEFLRALRDGELPPPPIGRLLGFTVDEVDPGRVVFTLEPGEHLLNPNAVLHGGVAATMIDTVTGCAVTSQLPAGSTCATLQLNLNFVRSLDARSPPVRCEGWVVHLGRRSAVAEGRLTLPDGRLVAHGTATLQILGPEGPRHGPRTLHKP